MFTLHLSLNVSVTTMPISVRHARAALNTKPFRMNYSTAKRAASDTMNNDEGDRPVLYLREGYDNLMLHDIYILYYP
jgi:hypothetical protein